MRVEAAADLLGRLLRNLLGLRDFLGGARAPWGGGNHLAATLTANLNNEMRGKLEQSKIGAAPHRRPGIHRSTEARGGRSPTVNGQKKQVVPASLVIRVHIAVAKKD